MYDTIDKVVFINLNHRQDRAVHFLHEMDKVGMPREKIHRFEGVYQELGALGCTMSHIGVLELCVKNGWERVLVCEDDFTIYDHQQFKTFFDHIHTFEWDVIMLSGNMMETRPFNDIVERCIRSQTSSAYIVSKHYFRKLLDNFRAGSFHLQHSRNVPRFAIDMFWQSLQSRDKWFIRRLGFQYNNFSDIEKRMCDYRC